MTNAHLIVHIEREKIFSFELMTTTTMMNKKNNNEDSFLPSAY